MVAMEGADVSPRGSAPNELVRRGRAMAQIRSSDTSNWNQEEDSAKQLAKSNK